MLSRETLLEYVWGDSDYRDPRTVDVHIRHLREKIEADPSEPEYLFTVRGVGYRFREERRLRSSRAQPRLNSVRSRLVLLFFVITAAAVGFVYLYVVPQLESNLTAQKISRLAGPGQPRARRGWRRRCARASPRPSSAPLVNRIRRRRPPG